MVNVPSLTRQMAQVLSNSEDESAQELITLIRKVIIPSPSLSVDATGVVHERVNSENDQQPSPQIYVGAKLIYEGIDPGIFVQMDSNYWYGPDDGPFLFRGSPIVPPRPGVPSYHDLEVAGYQFPSQGRYLNHKGSSFRSGIGPKGGGPYGRRGHQPRMVISPDPNHEEWDTTRHPKFPADGWYTKISTSQKKRLQRKFASRVYDGPLDHVNDPMRTVANMVWTREFGGSKSKKELPQSIGGKATRM
ncbi:hypothetical protein RHMOL_Rhmol05G0166200 [Rhododendron molle]|uniref:Uncharacterized protein n=1 Tax=Rhododendron molle TaxID=49168 RepID=A0ACC0NS05_RHOML|nr:hypothetical protein RHMOL_Rhmol05G0166200 [Rhododendron molle]